MILRKVTRRDRAWKLMSVGIRNPKIYTRFDENADIPSGYLCHFAMENPQNKWRLMEVNGGLVRWENHLVMTVPLRHGKIHPF